MIMVYIFYCKGLFNILVKTNEIQPSNRWYFFNAYLSIFCTFISLIIIFFSFKCLCEGGVKSILR